MTEQFCLVQLFKELSDDEYQKYGIKHYNIYENLEEFHISGTGTRTFPLCKKDLW